MFRASQFFTLSCALPCGMSLPGLWRVLSFDMTSEQTERGLGGWTGTSTRTVTLSSAGGRTLWRCADWPPPLATGAQVSHRVLIIGGELEGVVGVVAMQIHRSCAPAWLWDRSRRRRRRSPALVRRICGTQTPTVPYHFPRMVLIPV